VLKLVKTLNRALGDFSPSHLNIDEVFEVWWPKLELKLRDLPAEELAPKTARTERDLLEEMLALVRNLNRTSHLPRGDFEPIPVSEHPRVARQKELVSMVQQFDPKATKFRVHRAYSSGGDFCTVGHDDGDEYAFLIPDGLYNENLREYVRDQVTESIGSPEGPPRELGDN